MRFLKYIHSLNKDIALSSRIRLLAFVVYRGASSVVNGKKYTTEL